MRKGLLVIIIILSLFGCKKNDDSIPKTEKEGFLFGTLIKVIVYDKDEELAKKAIKIAFDEIERIDKKFNSKQNKSIISKLNNSISREIEIDEETKLLLQEVDKAYKVSNGGFDITITPLLETWGFGNEGNEKRPSTKELEVALEKVNYQNVILKDNKLKLTGKIEKIDTGAFLKGYAISKAKQKMKEIGITSAFITSISSIETLGTKPNNSKWRIGLQDPSNPREILEILSLDNKAMGVSGDYQTFVEIDGKKYHHILSVKDGMPINDKKMVVVVGEDAYKCDLYSTALFSMNIDEILEFVEKESELDVLIVRNDLKVIKSGNFDTFLEN